ncbi:MAG: hypothetical protein RLZZ76_757 [Candidatus Parcubacteria bacterium]|jgi:diaminopimelate epimerase
MTIRYFTIAGGNTTALVSETPTSLRRDLSLRLLEKVEQVGFIETKTNTLVMMGEELCINALLAFAFLKNSDKGKAQIVVNGESVQVGYTNTRANTSITIHMPHTVSDTTVLFKGIGFRCCPSPLAYQKNILRELSEKNNTPAFGYISYGSEAEPINPTIYVKDTDSCIEETACGSGSIAIHLTTGAKDIIQPTGQSISVTHTDIEFTIGAKVQEIFF